MGSGSVIEAIAHMAQLGWKSSSAKLTVYIRIRASPISDIEGSFSMYYHIVGNIGRSPRRNEKVPSEVRFLYSDSEV